MNSNDLDQISQLLDQKLEEKLNQKFDPIEKELKEHGKILSSHSKILSSLKKDQGTMLKMLDKEQMDQRKRLKKVEDHLELTPTAS